MPHPKVLGFRALYFAVAYGIFFIFFIFFIYNFQNVIFHFLAAARKIARLPEKKLFCPTLGEGVQSLAHRPTGRRMNECVCRCTVDCRSVQHSLDRCTGETSARHLHPRTSTPHSDPTPDLILTVNKPQNTNLKR